MRLVYLGHLTRTSDPFFDNIPYHIVTLAHGTFAIIVACVPCMKPFVYRSGAGLFDFSFNPRATGTYSQRASYAMNNLSKASGGAGGGGGGGGDSGGESKRFSKAFLMTGGRKGGKADSGVGLEGERDVLGDAGADGAAGAVGAGAGGGGGSGGLNGSGSGINSQKPWRADRIDYKAVVTGQPKWASDGADEHSLESGASDQMIIRQTTDWQIHYEHDEPPPITPAPSN
jgi:hypothetical protein